MQHYLSRQTKYLHIFLYENVVGRDGSVGTATRYGLDSPRIESRWEARFSAPVQTGPGGPPSLCTIGTRSFPGVKRPARGVDHPPHLAPRLKKEQSFTSAPPWAFVARSTTNSTFLLTVFVVLIKGYITTTECPPLTFKNRASYI